MGNKGPAATPIPNSCHRVKPRKKMWKIHLLVEETHSRFQGATFIYFDRYALSGDYYAYKYTILFIYALSPSHLFAFPDYLAEWGLTDKIIGSISAAFKSQLYPQSFLLNHQMLYKDKYLRTLESLKISDSSHSQQSNAADSLSSKWELCNTNKIISEIQIRGLQAWGEKPAEITVNVSSSVRSCNSD